MKTKVGLIAFAFLVCGGAYAVEGESASDDQISRAEEDLGDEPKNMRTQEFALGPQLGVITYTDNTGDTSARGTVGLNAEWNLGSYVSENPNLYVAFQTGAHVAKVGAGDANFFGGDSSTATGLDDATLVMAPANAKIGYNVSDTARVSMHGGGNIIYRSSAGAVRLADDDPAATESAWDVYPNVGGDVEVQVGKNVGILARPDFTLAPDETIFVGTLAANVMF